MKRAAWLVAGAAPVFWGAYTWGSHLLTPAGVWRGSRERRAVALTFDDGPDPDCTPRVLDILEREGVRGAFFMIGRRAAHASAVARRIADAGHDLGNHTWSHTSLWRCGPDRTEREIGDGHAAITQAAGAPPRFCLWEGGLASVSGGKGGGRLRIGLYVTYDPSPRSRSPGSSLPASSPASSSWPSSWGT